MSIGGDSSRSYYSFDRYDTFTFVILYHSTLRDNGNCVIRGNTLRARVQHRPRAGFQNEQNAREDAEDLNKEVNEGCRAKCCALIDIRLQLRPHPAAGASVRRRYTASGCLNSLAEGCRACDGAYLPTAPHRYRWRSSADP